MFLPLLLVLAAADGDAGPAAAAGPSAAVRTRVLLLEVAGDLDAAQRATLGSLIGARLSRFEALEIVDQKNVEKLLGVEADKQRAGCTGDENACLAELAGALQADVVAAPQAGKIGGTTVFTLQLIDQKGVTVGRGSAQVSGLDDLAQKVSDVVDGVGREFTGGEPRDGVSSSNPAAATTTTTGEPAWRQPLRIGGAVGIGVGLVAIGLGAIPAVMASGAEGDLAGLRVRYIKAGRDDDLLQQAAVKQRDADDARGLWNDAGIYAVWGGLVVAAAGGAALAAGFLVAEAP